MMSYYDDEVSPDVEGAKLVGRSNGGEGEAPEVGSVVLLHAHGALADEASLA